MANQTITTDVNYDDPSISELLNGETLTINGGSLTINADVRWNQQAAVFGNITCSATLGGNVFFDATKIWEIPFDASTGNVPTQNALNSNQVIGATSGATGELLRVWAANSLTPVTAGGAMPTTGFIKLRSKTGNFQDNEIITLPGGATITVNSATGGKRSWIHVVGANTLGITLNRLNKWQCRGDWYYLGETNGTDDQTFQFPVTDNCSGIQIETSPGSNVYEWYPNVHYRWGTATQFIPTTDGRGKFCGQDVTTGVITIARRATNACGFKPPSGCKVRVPNIILSNSSSANWNANLLDATLANRYETITTGLGEIDLEHVSCNWYLNLTSVYNFKLKNSTWGRQLVITTPGSPIEIDNCCSGCDISDPYTSTPTATNGLLFATNYQGATVNNCRITHSNAFNGGAVFFPNFTNNLVCTNTRFDLFGGAGSQDRNNTTNPCIQAASLTNSRFENCQFFGGRISLAAGLNLLFKNIQYCDKISGATNAVFVNSILTTNSSTTNLTIDGLSWFENLTNVYPGTALFAFTDTLNVIARNIGTKTTPLASDATLGPISAAILTNARNIVLQRIYCDTFRTAVLVVPTTAQDIKCYDLRGAYANTFNSPGFNVDTRGAKATATAGTITGARGIHWRDGYTSATAGFIRILGIEPTSATANQVSLTLNGAGGWTGTGSVVMPSLGDECVWTQQYFALGHTGFSSVSFVGTNTGNFTFTFQYDTGSGWNGTWLTLDNATLTGLGAINPATGIKMMFRAVVNTASSTNAINFISCITTSTTEAQLQEQPLVPDSIGHIENIISGSRIQIYNENTATELYNNIVSGTIYDYEYLSGTLVNTGDIIRIRVTKLGYLPQELISIATATGFSAAGNQQIDLVYNSNAIDGSSVSEFIADYPNVQIDVSDADQTTTVQRVYAWLRYIETTQQGIAEWFDAVNPTDDINYEINNTLLDLKFDNTQSTPVIIGGGRIYRKDGSTVISSTSNSIQMDPKRVYSTNGGGGGSGASAADIWSYPSRTLTSGAAPSAAQNAAAVRTELSTELARIDTTISSRNATTPDNTSIAAIKAKTDNLPANPAAVSNIPTASQNASQVRSELATELGRMDVAVSTRLAGSAYTAPDNANITAIKAKTDNLPSNPAASTDIPSSSQIATQVRTELATELSRIDVAISTRLATGGYTAPDNLSIMAIKSKTDNLPANPASVSDIPTAIQNATQVRTELAAELGRLDVAVSTRFNGSSYVAPDNASITAIKAKTDTIPSNIATTGDVPTTSQIASQVRTELATELSRIDVAVSTRLASVAFVAPDNVSIAAIKAKTDNLPSNPASVSDIPSSSQIASQVRTELSTELGRLDVAVSTRLASSSFIAPDNASITAIKLKTDNLPSIPANEATLLKTLQAAKLAAALSA